MSETLAMADPECAKLWENLNFAYTETAGHPLLREEIVKTHYPVCACCWQYSDAAKNLYLVKSMPTYCHYYGYVTFFTRKWNMLLHQGIGKESVVVLAPEEGIFIAMQLLLNDGIGDSRKSTIMPRYLLFFAHGDGLGAAHFEKRIAQRMFVGREVYCPTCPVR
jgi:hypothetical protein